MSNSTIQNLTTRGKRGRGKGKRGIAPLRHHLRRLKVARGASKVSGLEAFGEAGDEKRSLIRSILT